MPLSPLQARIARDIVSYVRRERFAIGHHLVESQLATTLNVSRTPVKFAMGHLVEKGMLTYDRNRGFFLARASDDLGDLVSEVMENSDDPLYLKLAELRLSRQLPELFTEIEFMRQFDVSRAALRAVLSRIQQEGWVEQRAGQGWRLLPMIDSVEAYEESYSFRATIEPSGILSPTFQIDRETLAACRRQQEFIANGGYLTMTPQEFLRPTLSSTRLWRHVQATASCSRPYVASTNCAGLSNTGRQAHVHPVKARPKNTWRFWSAWNGVTDWQPLIKCDAIWNRQDATKSIPLSSNKPQASLGLSRDLSRSRALFRACPSSADPSSQSSASYAFHKTQIVLYNCKVHLCITQPSNQATKQPSNQGADRTFEDIVVNRQIAVLDVPLQFVPGLTKKPPPSPARRRFFMRVLFRGVSYLTG